MNLHDRLRALAGELSDDYVLVTRAEGKLGFATSSAEFATEVLPELTEAIRDWGTHETARDLKHHHGGKPDAADSPGATSAAE
jgi:hypothetical protein